MKHLLLAILITLCSCHPFLKIGKFSVTYSEHLRDAERYSREDKFEKAIESYLLHIEDRLAEEERPDWENPYFYYIIIGDLQLREGKIDKALSSYEHAEKKKVDSGFVSDRYRYAATWQEKQGKLAEAIEILSKYRDRDPLLFDLMADRIAKKLVAQEEEKVLKNDPPSAIVNESKS